MIGWELPPHNSGGLGVACFGLAKALSAGGAKITFVLPKRVDLKVDFMEIVFADVKEAEDLHNSYSTLWMSKTFLKTGDFPADYVRAALFYGQKIREIAAKLRADVIHAHDWLTYPAAIAAKEILKVPLVVHIHNTVFDRGCGNANRHEYEIEKKGFEEADKIVSVSNFTKNTLVERYGISPDKIQTVYNGIEATGRKQLAPALKPMKDLGYKIVLYLGRITLQKGPDYFIKAAGKVLEYYPKALFVIAGSGDLQEQVMSEAAHLGIVGNIVFTGFLRGDDRDRIYQAADLFVMPSVSEPFGIVPLEAINNGTPVMVSKQSGVSEVLDHALKVDFWDVDEMANKILAVLNYPSLANDLIDGGSRELPSINWNESAGKCIEIYNQLIYSQSI